MSEPCEDAVSREVALKALAELPHEYKTKEQRARTGGIAACQVIVEELPPVTPKQRTGHWIDTDEWRETVDGFEQWGYFRKCSKCGYVFKFLEIDNYCPNCGCKMEVSNENE